MYQLKIKRNIKYKYLNKKRIMDIIEKIDKFLGNVEGLSESTFVHKSSVIQILNIINEELNNDDKVFLEMFLEEVEKNWSLSNKTLINNFYKVLRYYGIKESNDTRKTIVDVRGKTPIRKFVDLSKNQKITNLLGDVL
jgi:hypothetical protein